MTVRDVTVTFFEALTAIMIVSVNILWGFDIIGYETSVVTLLTFVVLSLVIFDD